MILAQETITETANQFQGTVKALVLIGIAVVTLALTVMTGVRTRSWIPAFGVLLVGAAMWWAVNNWERVQGQVGNELDQDAGGGGGGGQQQAPNVGG